MITSLNDREIIRGISKLALLAVLMVSCEGLDPSTGRPAGDADASDAPAGDELLYACPKGQFVCTTPKGTKGPCSDHKSDPANCGKCGRVCSKTQKCTNGACVTPNPCPSGQFICTDAKGTKGPCSDHKSDAANCGKCGNVCSKTQKCTNGTCVTPNPCPSGQFICTDPKGTKGPCSDHKSDAANCGACGNVCSKAQKCINGACVSPNPCPPGQFICQSKEGASGPCSDHKTDVANCGSCGNVCSKTQKCIDGACVSPNPCPPGQFICQSKEGASGPCSDHKTDVANCGSCGNVCSKTQKCINGACTNPGSSCPPGQFACLEQNGALGPCSDHRSDPNHCGTCGLVCAKFQTCSNGVCTNPACPPGQWSCLEQGGLSQCSDHKSDNVHCGSCGVTCIKPTTCRNGACQF